jgi:hypothetical protein
MKLDFDFRRPMEIEYIYSKTIEEAAKAGFEMSRFRCSRSSAVYPNPLLSSGWLVFPDRVFDLELQCPFSMGCYV